MKNILFLCLGLSVWCTAMAQPNPGIDRKAENIASFTRLYGYVRYFYPGDEAADIDWTKFELYAISRVEGAKNTNELKSILDSLFLPIAPTLRIYDAGKPEKFNRASLSPIGKDTGNMHAVSWQHLGLGQGNMGVYKDFRIGRDGKKPHDYEFGNFMATIPTDTLRGKDFKLRAAVRVASDYYTGAGHLWARVDRTDGKVGFFSNTPNNPIKRDEWRYYELYGDIDYNATNLNIGAMLYGPGSMWVDDVQLFIKNNKGDWVLLKGIDGDFENASEDKFPRYWFQPSGTKEYEDKVSDQTSAKGKKSVLVTDRSRLFDDYNHIGDYIQKNIGGGLACIMPLALWGTENNTYPLPDKKAHRFLLRELKKKVPANYNTDDHEPAIANLVTLWNDYEHFYPYFDKLEVDWQKALTDALKEIYLDHNNTEYIKTLKKCLCLMKDGHGVVHRTNNPPIYSPGIRLAYVENKLVVNELLDIKQGANLGDIVLSVDGKDAKSYVDSLAAYSNGGNEKFRIYGGLNRGVLKDSGMVTTFKIVTPDGVYKTILSANEHNARKINYSVNDDSFKKINDQVYYINLNNISSEGMRKLIPELMTYKSIILDMRGYPRCNTDIIGHLLTREDTFRSWMRVPEVILPDHIFSGYKEYGWQLAPSSPHISAKIICITDERAISYAESFTGMLQGHHLATIIGQPTAGTNGNVNPVNLLGGYTYNFTGMQVLKLDGTPMFGTGFTPDISIERTIKGIQSGRDEFLDKAIELGMQ